MDKAEGQLCHKKKNKVLSLKNIVGSRNKPFYASPTPIVGLRSWGIFFQFPKAHRSMQLVKVEK